MSRARAVHESAFAPFSAASHPASEPQRQAIEAAPGPLLVLAGPGAGKTFCLTERIRFLIEQLGFAPDRICAFTFTNKAAGEIAVRLERTLGARAARVKSGTMHSYCAELLREMGSRVGLPRGFGIADEAEQRAMLRRAGVRTKSQGGMLKRWTAHRFLGQPLKPRDADRLTRYERFLERRERVDFDMLLLRAARLLEDRDIADRIGARWDCVLVDEFQDLNRVQYAIVRALARGHRHVFAVGDDEQSIYSWAGADPAVFRDYVNDFGITSPIELRRNHRCPKQVMELAGRLIELNTPIFGANRERCADRESLFAVAAATFPSEDAEMAWVLDDIARDREAHGLRWGDFALLYRKHQIGDAAEAAFLAQCLPCRLAQGRALADDAVVGYAIAALKVIAGGDVVDQERFMEMVLPETLLDHARARAEEHNRSLLKHLGCMAVDLPRGDSDRKRIWRALYALRNLAALGARHQTLTSLIEELLSHNIGDRRNPLEDHCDDLSDPLGHDEVAALASRLDAILVRGCPIRIPVLGGEGIGIQGMLRELGFACEVSDEGPAADIEHIGPDDAPSLGIPLALLKAAQLRSSRGFPNVFLDFTAVDIETTDRDVSCAEVVEIAAVRVRNGRVVAEYDSLVRPRVPIAPEAAHKHGFTDADLVDAPFFEEIWPAFRAFCGTDMVVAHNGHSFDFPILRRMAAACEPQDRLCIYDSLPLARDLCPGSGRLSDVARYYGIVPGEVHRALADTRTLASVVLALGEAKIARSRKTSHANLLDHLGVALALSNTDPLNAEAQQLRELAVPYALGRYSDCLERYRDGCEELGDPRLPTVGEVIRRLGGEELMHRIRAETSADERYPTMARLRRLMAQCGSDSLHEQMQQMMELVALSSKDGVEVDADRVNLLTLHAAKGLEFSRVYVLGVEDGELPGISLSGPAGRSEIEEARRLLYVGMTRAKDRLVLTRAQSRGGMATGGHRFLDEMGLVPRAPLPRLPS